MWNSEKVGRCAAACATAHLPAQAGFQTGNLPNGALCFEKGRAPKVLGASLLRDTTYGKANEEQFAAVRKPENFIVPGVRDRMFVRIMKNWMMGGSGK